MLNNSNNQLKMGVVLSYLTMGLNMLIQLSYTPIMIRLLGQSEYGLYTLVSGFVSYLGLFSLGFTGSYLRFYSRYIRHDDDLEVAKLNGLFLILFIMMSVVAIVTGGMLSCFPKEVFGSNLNESELKKAQILMRILVINIGISFPASLFDSILGAHERFVFQKLVNLCGVICNPLICLPLLLLGHSSIAIVSVTTVISITRIITNIIYCLRVLKAPFCYTNVDFTILREISEFSFFIFLNMIIDQVNWSVDKFILGRVSGTKAVAVYGVGAQINTLYTGFSTAISSVFAPQVHRIANENTMKEALFTNLFIKVGRIQFMVLGLIATGFIIFGKYFVTDIYAGKEYNESYFVALVLLLPASIPLIQNLGIEIQRSVNKHKFRSIIYFFMALANIVISIPLARKFGPIGSAFGTGVTMIISNGIIMNIYYKKSMKIGIGRFWINILSIMKAMIIPLIIGVIIFEYIKYDNIFSFFLFVFIYSVIYFISIYMFGMDNKEKNIVRRVVKREVGHND